MWLHASYNNCKSDSTANSSECHSEYISLIVPNQRDEKNVATVSTS